MSKVNFKKSDLLELDLPWSALEEKIIDQTRWSTIFEIIFEKGGKFYRTSYSKGSTECQSEEPWEYEDKVTCEEVQKITKTITVDVWEPV
jgi:hypothetical protein